jgi:hypothetical protein
MPAIHAAPAASMMGISGWMLLAMESANMTANSHPAKAGQNAPPFTLRDLSCIRMLGDTTLQTAS